MSTEASLADSRHRAEVEALRSGAAGAAAAASATVSSLEAQVGQFSSLLLLSPPPLYSSPLLFFPLQSTVCLYACPLFPPFSPSPQNLEGSPLLEELAR